MMTPFEHLKAKLEHAKSIDADAVRVDIEELASVLDEVEMATEKMDKLVREYVEQLKEQR